MAEGKPTRRIVQPRPEGGWEVVKPHHERASAVTHTSTTPSRIDENFAIFDFELTADDMPAIARLDRKARRGPNPNEFSRIP
jgi:2,5-diketo-D-gluconate reductase A